VENILVLEDEKKVAAMIQQTLINDGYKVDVVEHPQNAREFLKHRRYDLMILDVMLPETSGIDFARELRAKGDKELILMLTALSTTNDNIKGLDSGADDYLTKPFEFDELKARIRALLRRNNQRHSTLKNGELTLDLISRTVARGDKNIELTSKEFSLLEFLMRNSNKVVDRNSIARQVWGTDFDPDSNVIDVYINHLRKKIHAPMLQKNYRFFSHQFFLVSEVSMAQLFTTHQIYR